MAYVPLSSNKEGVWPMYLPGLFMAYVLARLIQEGVWPMYLSGIVDEAEKAGSRCPSTVKEACSKPHRIESLNASFISQVVDIIQDLSFFYSQTFIRYIIKVDVKSL